MSTLAEEEGGFIYTTVIIGLDDKEEARDNVFGRSSPSFPLLRGLFFQQAVPSSSPQRLFALCPRASLSSLLS